MRHLSPSEFVDLLDEGLDPARAEHLAQCHACRAQANGLQSTLTDARSDGMPEPSPLFWDHFQKRVQHAVDAEPSPRRSWRLLRPMPALITVMVVAVTIATVALYPRGAHDAPALVPLDVAPPAAIVPAVDSPDDPAWMLLRDVAADMAIEDAPDAGMTLGPGETENAILQLTPDERNELGRLLQDALKRAGA
jgi:hypothetical protein